MEFLKILLYLFVFVISLGFLITIHELGHLTAAKIFKVYCYEFSIGMGPKVYQRKPNKDKGQETLFTIRAAPIGGYVSMAGEDLEDAEGVDPDIVVAKDRTLEGKSRWKQIIIMAAGVFMNFVIGFILFALNYTCCTQTAYNYASNSVIVSANSVAEKAGLQTGDQIILIKESFYCLDNDGYLPSEATYTINSETITRYAYTDAPESYTDYNSTVSSILSGVYYNTNAADGYVQYSPKTAGDVRKAVFTFVRDGEEKTAEIETKAAYSKAYFFSKETLSWGTIGVGCDYTEFRYSFGEGMKVAGKTWGEGCGAVVNGLASLFTPAGWKNIGGIVATFEISAIAMESGISTFLYLWGLLSVNLGIVNLFPFPGLDGWSILITIVEQVVIWFKKLALKIKGNIKNKDMTPEQKAEYKKSISQIDLKKAVWYQKAKRIVSTVGLILIIVLAVLLIIKDLIFPII